MTDIKPEEQIQMVKRNMLVSVKAGCLTFLVAGISLAVGLWLDYRMDSLPRWTLSLLIGTAPLTLVGVYLIVRRAIRRSRGEEAPEDDGGETGEPAETKVTDKG